MDTASISRLIFQTIPQIYEAAAGPCPVRIRGVGEGCRLFSVAPLSPELESYLGRAERICDAVVPYAGKEIFRITEREWIQEKFAVAWLMERTKISSWELILDYFQRLSRRTIENRRLSKTVVIEPGRSAEDTAKLTDRNYSKVFDWLGTNPLTYYRVDETLGIKALEAIALTDLKDLRGYRFYPDYLHPAISTLKHPDSVVIHMSENGGLMIADRDGILASKRFGSSWTIYDVDHILGSVARILERQITESARPKDPTCVACSLFQVIFDISMKRQGGLIVLDKTENLPRYVVKGIERNATSPLNKIFTHSPFNGLEYSIPEVRKLVELSSVDGALILDLEGNLVQVGSMIMSHPAALNRFGTRDAAAYSAAKYGATAVKVSADGQVALYFTTPEDTGDEVHRIDFL